MSISKRYICPETEKEHHGHLVDSKDGKDVIECTHCGFKHVVPIPNSEELKVLYEEEYFSKDKPNYFKDGEEDLSWQEMTYKQYFNLFEEKLKPGKKRLLEIGSGPGYFLKLGKELGWDVVGVEPSPQAAEYAAQFGVEVVNDFFTEEIAEKLGSFDVVFMDMLLEHVPDPTQVLKLVKNVLKEGGLVCIVSPNDYNPLQKVLTKELNFEPWWVVPNHHINYFSIDSITNLLTNTGFKVVDKTVSFPMELFLLMGKNYLSNQPLGREMHTLRKNFESTLLKSDPNLFRSLYHSFAENKIGRSFVVIGLVSRV